MPLNLPSPTIISLALASVAVLVVAAIVVQLRFRRRLLVNRESLAVLLGGRLLKIGQDTVGVEGRLDGRTFRLYNESRGRGGIGLRIDIDLREPVRHPFRLVGGMRDPYSKVGVARKFWQGFRLLKGASIETRGLIERSSELRAALERASHRDGGIVLELQAYALRYEQLDFGRYQPQDLAALIQTLTRLAVAAERQPS